ncbi:MAG: TlpA family protein disulfide reductase [Bordetella sp.]|uniref:TlpA family protein disulfide reductase n=1 Tax=Bordetella sp. TaxID=28081 RepID=UPI003F7C9D9E
MNRLRRRLLQAGLAGATAPALRLVSAAPTPSSAAAVAAEEAALRAATGPHWAVWQGGPTPALALPDLQGRPRNLTEFLGSVTIVTFWATWCAPCRQEIPIMSALANRYADKGLKLIAVDAAEARPRIDAFLARLPISGLVLHDRNGTAMHDWHVVGMPANFVVDRGGKLRLWHLGTLDWTDPVNIDSVIALL